MNKTKIMSGYSIFSKLIIGINIFVLVIHLFAPLLGGVFLIEGVLIPASIIGLFLITNIIAKQIESEERVGLKLLSILSVYEILCAILWFDYPFSLFFILLNISANYGSYFIVLKRNNKETK